MPSTIVPIKELHLVRYPTLRASLRRCRRTRLCDVRLYTEMYKAAGLRLQSPESACGKFSCQRPGKLESAGSTLTFRFVRIAGRSRALVGSYAARHSGALGAASSTSYVEWWGSCEGRLFRLVTTALEGERYGMTCWGDLAKMGVTTSNGCVPAQRLQAHGQFENQEAVLH